MDIPKNYLQKIEKKKAPKYKWQETCLEIIDMLKLTDKDKGLVWALYKRKGSQAVESLLGEIKQGEVKGNPVIYIKYLIKSI